jgi:enoyl-CoA hydratase
MPILFQMVEPGIGLLLVNRPHVRNALNWETMEIFAQRIEELHAQPELRVVILSGAGKAFIAGGDLKQLHAHPTLEDGMRLSRLMTDALARLEALPCPTIAAINGPARGGGAEIAVACDLRVMDAKADLGFVQIGLGLTPGWGAGQRLLRIVGYSRALDILTSGRIVQADEALAYGLANRIAPAGETLEIALEMARQIAQHAPAAVQALKRLLAAGLRLKQEEAALAEQSEFPPLWASEVHLQAVARFLERKGGER